MRKSNCRIINGLQASLQWCGRRTGTGFGRAPRVTSQRGVGTSAGAWNPLRRDPLGKSWLPSYGGSQVNQIFHQAKKQQTSTEVCCVESSRCRALGCPCHQDLCLSLPTQHPAWRPCSTRAGYWPQLHFSAAARNAIFFIPVYKLLGFLSTTLDDPQGRWEFLPGQAFHLVPLSWSSRVAASRATRHCLGEPGLAQTQLFLFSKPDGN